MGKSFRSIKTFASILLLVAVTVVIGILIGSTIPWDPGITPVGPSAAAKDQDLPFSYLQAVRVGEISSPGPEILISTLNVASLCGNQDEISRSYGLPTTCMFTETCLTKHILPTISRKAKAVQKFIVPSCLSAPRKSAHKSDSISKGESGGVLLNSDLPARAGGVPMDDFAWASTRIVEALVHVCPNLVVRLIGVYGFSKRRSYKCASL